MAILITWLILLLFVHVVHYQAPEIFTLLSFGLHRFLLEQNIVLIILC